MKPDFLGARGSNTGDDFHEWWALRSALRLLTPDTSLLAVTVEGVNLDNKEQGLTEWSSVDCGLYYGGHTIEQAEQLTIEQLKYSSSNPEKAWTVSELTTSKSTTSNNSIIKGLADAFCAVQKKRPDLIKNRKLKISLVSNRPVGKELQLSLTNSSHEKHEKLRAASSLSKSNFKEFISLFDFSNCGTGSRFEQEESAINEILSLTFCADRGFVLDLKDRIHQLMLPEATGRYITSETVLTWMNVSDPLALFPCPPRLKPVEESVNRTAAVTIQEAMVGGDQYICLHGEGGSGKTTVLKQVERLLPNDSVMIIYDCYGAGTYLDSEAYRHRPKDAYLQIINEIAAQLRLPLLISHESSIDYVKAFALRVESASQILKAQAGDALLTIVIDAADNTVTGAKQCKPEETSFIHELIKIGSLPSNVRLMISARTGRLESLHIPDKYRPIEISNFSLEETTRNVLSKLPRATEAWIEDFHNLSNQNPRVQSYAFDYAGSDPSKAIDFLMPNGKGLDQIFEACFQEAILKEGNSDVLSLVCSSLIALPSPVPKQHLASVVGISIERINDIVSDLPGMRVLDYKVGFADEDVEFFVRKKAEPKLLEAYQRSAAYFYANHENDEYSAMHLASALFLAGQGQKIIEVIEKDEAPRAIKDQIIRREVQRQRLQLAMKVCRSAGDPEDAIFTLLVGAEAIKTDDAVDKIIAENPDLSVHFASDTVGRNILYSSKTYQSHGRFLSHIVARDTADRDFIAAREKKRILREWMNRRSEDIERQKSEQSEPQYQHIDPWPIELEDIAAVAHSVLVMEGYQATYKFIRSWKPKNIHYRIALILLDRLLSSGNATTVQEFLASGCIPEPWSSLFSIPLALVGHDINFAALEKSLCNKVILKYCVLDALERHENKEGFTYTEMILSGCEILAANGVDLSAVEPILEYLCPDKWRQVNNIYTHDITKNDVGFRAYSLLRRYRGLDAGIESYLIDSAIPEDLDEVRKNKLKQELLEKHRDIKDNLSDVMSVYAVRADVFLSNILPKNAEEKIKSALSSLFSNSWRMSKNHYFESICSRISLSIAHLSAIPDIDMTTVLTLVKASFKGWPSVFSAGQRNVISSLIKIPELRSLIVKDIYDRSIEVKNLKTAASEKIRILLDLSRILLFVDKDEAREVFKIAVDIANDVDVDAMHDVSLFAALARNARKYYSQKSSQQIASRMATITTEYGTLLDGYDHFPWNDAISAVAFLDMAKAISLVGYWEDCGLVQASETVPSLISIGVSEGTLSSAQAASLLNFCDDLNIELLTNLVSTANPVDATQLVEDIAKAELLRFNNADRLELCKNLNELVKYDNNSGYWHSALNKQIEFKGENKKTVDTGDVDLKEKKFDKKEFLDRIDVVEVPFKSPAKFINYINSKKKEARYNDCYIGVDEILKSVSNRLESRNRIDFLNTLVNEQMIAEVGYAWAKILYHCIALWEGTSHAVSSWKNENLPILIINHLGRFFYNEGYGDEKRILENIIHLLHFNKAENVSLLLNGLEKNVEYLPLPSLYAVIRLLADYCSEEQITDVTERYVERLTKRLKIPNIITNPEHSVESAFACQIYSFLGDVDTRVRWRAAHSIRASARLGDYKTIIELTHLYDRKSMLGYREDNVPFYWLSARLWLIVTFDRISSEVPKAIEPVARWLLKIASDQDFPHVLIRHFAKSCLNKLLSGHFIEFEDQEVDAVHAINTSLVSERSSKRRISKGRYKKANKERRFSFDPLDTLPYVYPSAIDCFADVDEETFLDEAEIWIIDRWENSSDLPARQNEPRKHKFERIDYQLYSHSHGSMPTIERHRYYLEWHAMWCSIGSLMLVKALAEPEYDNEDYGTLDGFLRREGLTQPPHWSSDLRCPKPLESRFHKPSAAELEDWLTTISEDDFELELGLASSEGHLIVDSNHNIHTNKYRSSVRISSSLVNPDTGPSLIRALQTSNDSHDYRLPPVNHEFEIDNGPYVLRGWLTENSDDSRLDETDTFNYGVRMIETQPSGNVLTILGVHRSEHYPANWVDSFNGDKVFFYDAWGDLRDSSREREYIYDGDVISDGHRLKVSRSHLKKYLKDVGLDLIVEVELTRRVSKNGNTRNDQDSQKEARYTRLYLLRNTGEIFTAEGCIGSWTPPSD